MIHPLRPFEILHVTENYYKKLSCAKARSVVHRCMADVCGVFGGADGCHSPGRRQPSAYTNHNRMVSYTVSEPQMVDELG